MNNRRCSFHPCGSENSKGFQSFTSKIREKDQLCNSSYTTTSRYSPEDHLLCLYMINFTLSSFQAGDIPRWGSAWTLCHHLLLLLLFSFGGRGSLEGSWGVWGHLGALMLGCTTSEGTGFRHLSPPLSADPHIYSGLADKLVIIIIIFLLEAQNASFSFKSLNMLSPSNLSHPILPCYLPTLYSSAK